jgi:hypothetical protein
MGRGRATRKNQSRSRMSMTQRSACFAALAMHLERALHLNEQLHPSIHPSNQCDFHMLASPCRGPRDLCKNPVGQMLSLLWSSVGSKRALC